MMKGVLAGVFIINLLQVLITASGATCPAINPIADFDVDQVRFINRVSFIIFYSI